MTEEKKVHKPRNIFKRIGRILLFTILGIIFLVILILILIQTPPVQNFIVQKATSFLEKKLNTRVDIGKVYIGFPKNIVIENIYVEDQKKDTLLAGGKIKVDISMMKLLDNEIEINEVKLDRITGRVIRILPDTVYNFQFIIDAFSSEKKKPVTEDTASLKMNVKYVQLDNIRLVYNDVITGNDMVVGLKHFDAKIDKFDLDALRFDIPVTNLSGVTAKVYQSKPLMVSEPVEKDRAEAKEPSPMQLNLRKIRLSEIMLDYKNDVSAMYTTLNLGELIVNSKKIDLDNRIISLEDLNLNNTVAGIRLGKKEEAKVIEKEVEQELATQADAGWRITVNSVRLNKNNIQFDNDNKAPQRHGMDYAHIKASDLTFHLDNLLYSKDSIAGIIRKASLTEKSGFRLNRWQADFLYAGQEAYLKNLVLQTPGTELQKSIVLRYPSIEALKNNIGSLLLDVDLQNSKVQVKDILTFVPDLRTQPAFAQANNTLWIDGRIRGSVSRLQIDALRLRGFSDTRVNLKGTVIGLPDMKKVGANLYIQELSTSRRDIALLAPKGSLPQGISIPERIRLTGKITGGMQKLNPDLLLSTSLGAVSVKGTIDKPSDKINSRYNVLLETRSLDLGAIMQNRETMGKLSARFTAKGRGYDPKTANAALNGVIRSMTFKKYEYRNLALNASITNQQLAAKANIQDPNIHFSLDASGKLSGKYPSIRLTANIDSVKTFPLHLTKDSIIYRGNIIADFPVTDPDNLEGDLFVTKSLLVMNQQRIELDTLQMSAGTGDSGRFVRLHADAINFEMYGQYKLTQLGNIFQQAIQPYFAVIPAGKPVKTEPYNFTFTGSIVDKPLLRSFVPALGTMQPVIFNGRFSNDTGWAMNLQSPLIVYGTNRIENMQMNAGTAKNAIGINLAVARVKSGESIEIFATSLKASIANNQVDFSLNVKDKALKDKYRLSAVFAQPSPEKYTFSLKPEEFLLNYDPWMVSGDNQITISKSDIHARNVVLSKQEQRLSINSLAEQANAPMEVRFDKFQLATLANFVQSDSLLVDGELNGKAVLNNLTVQPTFTSDLLISDLSFKKDTIGNIALKVNNTVANTFAADVNITGRGNDVALTGNYFVKPENNSSFDMNLDIRQIQLNTLEGVTMGAIRNASGILTGKFAVNGTVKAPSVNGNLDFKNAAFTMGMLNSYFKIDDESISVNNEGVKFSTFTIKDSMNNTAILDGMLYYNPGYTDYRFDLTFRANDFRALNTSKKDNQIYYGQLYFNSNLKIKGTQVKPSVEGSLTINEKTRLTVVLPQREPGMESREGIVVFVDKDAVPNDSLFMARYDSINKSNVLGLDIAINIAIDKKAEFNLIVDEGNGDFLKVRGEAALSGGIDPSGKITLAGSYELEEGAYELNFNFLKRRFVIQKGSTLIWTGEPTKADVNITAVYIANTAPLDLVENQLGGESNITAEKNYYRQKLPFEVHLKMKGELLKPEITFDIILPSDQNYSMDKNRINVIDTKLQMIRQEPSELNKQVFALLLLGRFVTENPFASSGGGMTAESIARQSVSQLLTEQLNKLASDLVEGVDINFNLESTTEDYVTGQRQNRTDLNVALSKRLLNDRLTVTVGSNFELEGAKAQSGAKQRTNNLAGNVSIEYQLSKDGRYALRAYRKNEYEGVLEGYIIETGVGFVMSVDYNRFRQIFLSKKQREQKRKIRMEKRQTEADNRKNDINTSKETHND